MVSYADDTGLFWETAERKNRGGPRTDPLVTLRERLVKMMFDDSYVTPRLVEPPPGFLAIDFETRDPGIYEERGPSWAFDDGEILGLAVAFDGYEAYFAFNHCSGNVDSVPVMRWLKAQFERTDLVIICANAVYDLGWARREIGLYPRGGVVDVQFMAALIDEFQLHYSLDAIAHLYLGAGKVYDRLHDIETQLNIPHTLMMAALQSLPGPVVAKYAAGDARRTYDVFMKMLPKIEAEGLSTVHKLESDLIPMSTEMRRVGIRVDIDKAERASKNLKDIRIPELQSEIRRLTGVQVEPWAAVTCEAALNTIGVTCPRTAKNAPEIKAPWLEELGKTQPVAAHILKLRQLSKAATTFLDGHILYHQHKGRLHAEFNQLKSERDETGFGTVTGRYSATNPGLQQIPVNDPELGPLIRGMFLPEDGEILASLDYASQEPRLTVHFAYLFDKWTRARGGAGIRGVDEIVARYNAAGQSKPRIDYHQFIADLCGIPRWQAKRLNLGLAYGMGGAKLAHSLGLPTEWKRIEYYDGRQIWRTIRPEEIAESIADGFVVIEVAGPEAQKILRAWEDGAPFIRGLYKITSEIADERGHITTLLRRRCRFEKQFGGGFKFTHAAMNRLCQSSAADQTKTGMLALWNAGVTPRLTVHDELVFSVPNEAVAESYIPYMRDAIKLEVPTCVDIKFGADWGCIPK